MATFNPPASHAGDPEAGLSYAEPGPAHNTAKKRRLLTYADVKIEWQTGSRKRVVKHFVVSMLIGLVVGGLLGVAIGLAFRYTKGKH